MAKTRPVGMSLVLLAAMGLAFLAGRTSVSEKPPVEAANGRSGPRSAERPSPRRASQASAPGAGAGAVTSALQLRDIFKHSGGNNQLGTAMADATLARMNGREVSQLVHDLAATQAAVPGYAFTLEINAACARWGEIDPDAALAFALSTKQASFRAAALGSIFAGIAKHDPALARAKLAMIDEPSLRQSARSSLLSALMIASPDEWVAAIKDDPSLAQNYSLGNVASEWAMDDPVKAAERLKHLPANLQKGAVASIAAVWAGKDPDAALAWAGALADPGQRNQALAAVSGSLAARDPDAALASLDSLPPAARKAGLSAVFRTLFDLDHETAIAKATSLADPDDRKAALKLIAGGRSYGYYEYGDPFMSFGGGSRNSEQLTALLAELPAGSTRNNALGQLGQQLGSLSSAEAEAILAGYPPNEREKLQAGMLQSLAYRDPARALELYRELPPAKAAGQGTYILQNLARRDPEAALEFALASESSPETAQAVSAAFGQMAMDDPLAASRRLATLPEGPLRENAVATVASAWAQSDPEGARSWVESLTGDSKTRALGALIPSLAGSSPQAAAEIVGGLLASPDPALANTLSSSVAHLSQVWAQEDPEAAGQWVSGLPGGSLKNNAVSSMIGNWCQTDFEGATRWLDSLPDGEDRDAGVQSVVNTTSYRDPATAFEWAATIGSNSQRLNALANVVSQWRQSSPEKARSAVMAADLTEAERSQLLQQLK